MERKLILDRFEGEYGVCEDENRNIENILISRLPANVETGDTIIERDNTFVIDKEDTKARRERIEKLMKKLYR